MLLGGCHESPISQALKTLDVGLVTGPGMPEMCVTDALLVLFPPLVRTLTVYEYVVHTCTFVSLKAKIEGLNS
jgi:hypothetical protein